MLDRRLDDLSGQRPRFANAQTANSISGEANLNRSLRRFSSQPPIHPALHNGKQGLLLPLALGIAILGVVILSCLPRFTRNPYVLRLGIPILNSLNADSWRLTAPRHRSIILLAV